MPKFLPDTRVRAPGSKSKGSVNSDHTNLVYKRSGKNDNSECMCNNNTCFGCGKIGHMIRDYQMSIWKGKNDHQ